MIKKYIDIPNDTSNEKAYIIIDNAFIKEFYGYGSIEREEDYMMSYDRNNDDCYTNNIINNKQQKGLYEIEEKFSLKRLTPFDIKQLEIKSNYKIEAINEKSQFKKGYIYLSRLEKLKIDYDKKETVFHKAKVPSLIIGGVIGVVFTLIAAILKELITS